MLTFIATVNVLLIVGTGGVALVVLATDAALLSFATVIVDAIERFGPGRLLDAASGVMTGTSRVFHASFAVDAVLTLPNDSHPFLFTDPDNPSWVTWKEGHTVHAISAP